MQKTSKNAKRLKDVDAKNLILWLATTLMLVFGLIMGSTTVAPPSRKFSTV